MAVILSIVLVIVYLTKFNHACPSKPPKIPPRKETVLNCVRPIWNVTKKMQLHYRIHITKSIFHACDCFFSLILKCMSGNMVFVQLQLLLNFEVPNFLTWIVLGKLRKELWNTLICSNQNIRVLYQITLAAWRNMLGTLISIIATMLFYIHGVSLSVSKSWVH